MRIAWKILAGAAALVVVVLIGAAIAISTVDVNTLIEPVKARVKDVTGRELTVRGGADLKFSLEPKLVLKDVSLANAPWGTAPALASARRLELQIALIPLLSRRFDVIELALVDPVIALETDSAGRGNWELGRAQPAPTGGAEGRDTAATTPVVGNLSITGGTVTYRDNRSGHVTRIAIDKLALRSRSAQSPIAAQFSGKVDDVAVVVEGSLGSLESLLQQRWPYPVALKGKVDGTPTEVSTKVGKESTTYVLNDLDLRVGANTVGGKFSVVTGGARPKLVFGLAAVTLAVADLPLPVAAAPAPAGAATVDRAKMFSAAPIDFSILRAVDADGRIAIGKLRFTDGRELANVKVQLSLVAGRLDVSGIEATMFGGTLAGSMLIDAGMPANPSLLVRFNGTALDLGAGQAVRRRPSVPGKRSGDRTRVRGHTLVLRQRHRAGRSHGGLRDEQVGRSRQWHARPAQSTVDFSIQPKVNSGIPVDIPRLADLVRFSGPMTAPQVQVDASASVAAIASVGAAVSTGGLSVIGQALFARVEDGGATPCQIALGQKGSAAAKGKAAGTGGANPLEDVGRAAGRLFGK